MHFSMPLDKIEVPLLEFLKQKWISFTFSIFNPHSLQLFRMSLDFDGRIKNEVPNPFVCINVPKSFGIHFSTEAEYFPCMLPLLHRLRPWNLCQQLRYSF